MPRFTPQLPFRGGIAASHGDALTHRRYRYILSFLLMTWAKSTHATPLSLELAVERTRSARDCADREQLFALVQKYSQRTTVTTQPSRDSVRVTAQFDNRDGEYVAKLDFSGLKPGERSFSDRSTDCGSLEEAVAVAIVLLLDGETALREKPPATIEPPESSVSLVYGTVKVADRVPFFHSQLISVGAGPLWGFSPSISAWYGASFAVEFPWQVQLGLGALAIGPSSIRFENGSVDVSLIALELKGCKAWGTSFWFGVCTAPALGRLRGKGTGFDEGLVANLGFYAWKASVHLQVPIGKRWFVGGEVLTWTPLSKRTLSVENAGTAWDPASVWGGLGLRLGVRLD